MRTVWRWAVLLLVSGAVVCVLLGFGGRWHPVLNAIGYFRLHFGLLAAIGGLLALGPSWRPVKWIGFAAAALALAGLGPVWRAVERPAEGGQTKSVTVMTANVLGGSNRAIHLTASVLLAADADILATVEAPRGWSASGALLARHYPYNTVQPSARNGVIVWSKFPLRLTETAPSDRNTPAFATATADLGGGASLGVTGIHLSWPLVAGGAQAKQIALTSSLLSAETGPKILMGDFNAPPWSHAMKQVEQNTDLSMVGGLRRTWVGAYPNPVNYLMTGALYGQDIPAVLGHHIDHILVSDGVGMEQIEVITLPGSDHRAVWARIRVPLPVAGKLFAGG